MDACSSMRRAYILIVVLGLAAVVATLGWAFLDAHSTVMPGAMNRLGAARAQYLAESGIDLGTHFLMYPPTTVAPGDYWTGASGIAIDDTTDYTNVSVVQEATDLSLFTITAVGVAHDLDGSVRGKHSITAEVIVPPVGDKWQIPYALLAQASHWGGWGWGTYIPSTVEVEGDVHVEGGWLWSDAWCENNVSATEEVWWEGGGPPASITPWADSFSSPVDNPALYATYTIRGSDYTAYVYPSNTMTEADADALNAQDWSTTNPGRIVIRLGNLALMDDVEFHGTLVTTGYLRMYGTEIELTAVEDYPAVVTGGDIKNWAYGNSVDIVGSVLCGGNIDDNNTVFNMEVIGAFILRGRFNAVGSGDTFEFDWDSDRSVFWNLEEPSELQPITILSWQEN